MIPTIVFFTKIGVNWTFQNTYQASFASNQIFPFYKRATAIGICNFIARGVTITSSLVAELDRPIPCIILITFTIISFISALFLPSYSSEVEFAKREKRILDEGVLDEEDQSKKEE